MHLHHLPDRLARVFLYPTPHSNPMNDHPISSRLPVPLFACDGPHRPGGCGFPAFVSAGRSLCAIPFCLGSNEALSLLWAYIVNILFPMIAPFLPLPLRSPRFATPPFHTGMCGFLPPRLFHGDGRPRRPLFSTPPVPNPRPSPPPEIPLEHEAINFPRTLQPQSPICSTTPSFPE